ncbi:MAG TPA: NAD(P)-dependent oxidoreductase [Candidatus Acidoferrales bacterium]|nr:NAD(P)-dependent oxidoreductase [Candidatus Acidoferrales bacterium]
MKPRVGLIGLGLMGSPMAANFLKAGFPLTVWNRTAEKAQKLAKLGATAAKSPADAAAKTDILLTIVSDPPALEEVLWGEQGALSALKSGSVLIDSSTVSPALARRIAKACAEKSVAFLDAPVTGGTWGAEKGELVFMMGGEKETFERVRPVLEAVGKHFFLLGPNGAGQTVKLAMNLILALEVEALAEGLELVTSSGVDGAKLIEVLQSSMGRAPVLDVKAPVMLKHDFAPSFPLRLMHKDIRLAMELAKENGLELPAGAAAYKAYSAVKAAAKSDVDYAAIASYWKRN